MNAVCHFVLIDYRAPSAVLLCVMMHNKAFRKDGVLVSLLPCLQSFTLCLCLVLCHAILHGSAR